MHIFASWPYLGVGSANFRKRAPNGDEGEEEGDEEEEGRKRRRNPNLIAAATKFPTLCET